jgi:hypothetical protein
MTDPVTNGMMPHHAPMLLSSPGEKESAHGKTPV